MYFLTTEIYINLENKRQCREIFIATGIPLLTRCSAPEYHSSGFILRCAAPDVSIWMHLAIKISGALHLFIFRESINLSYYTRVAQFCTNSAIMMAINNKGNKKKAVFFETTLLFCGPTCPESFRGLDYESHRFNNFSESSGNNLK